MTGEVRVRFAPSPTGLLHIGNARTALYNKLFALQKGGRFILRIEDTDLARFDPAAEAAIMEDLRWLGLEWEEGPDVGGKAGPYHQSERKEIYLRYAGELLEQGKAYRCYCSPKELAQERAELLAKGEPPRYLGRCRNLSREESRRREQEGRSPTLRFAVPEGTTRLHDIIHGDKIFDNRMMGDFVIIRSDGRPSYNFAATVDDALMGITHVIRGEDHLPNTPRQILLYEALGFTPPRFAHHPLLVAPGGERLSKRYGATSVRAYREDGFLPLAIVNYLVLLGGGIKGGDEVMSWEDMVKRFALEGLGKGPAVFDIEKLRWLNRAHLRNMPGDQIFKHALPFLQGLPVGDLDHRWLLAAIDAIKENCATLRELRGQISPLLPGEISMAAESRALLTDPAAAMILSALRELVEAREKIREEDFPEIASALHQRTGLKGKRLFAPIRAALTGRSEGPELKKLLPLLGKKTILERLMKILYNHARVDELFIASIMRRRKDGETEHE